MLYDQAKLKLFDSRSTIFLRRIIFFCAHPRHAPVTNRTPVAPLPVRSSLFVLFFIFLQSATRKSVIESDESRIIISKGYLLSLNNFSLFSQYIHVKNYRKNLGGSP